MKNFNMTSKKTGFQLSIITLTLIFLTIGSVIASPSKITPLPYILIVFSVLLLVNSTSRLLSKIKNRKSYN